MRLRSPLLPLAAETIRRDSGMRMTLQSKIAHAQAGPRVIGKTYVSSRCPKCNDSRVVSFLNVELADIFNTGRPVNCMCSACNEIWPITPAERTALQRELED
jgi:hypothetical protein